MPLYEYQCDACGHHFEKIQKFSDPLVKECPVCGGPVQKLLSSPAIQFKGSGWYITDYARAGKEGGKSDGAKKDGAKSAAKSDGGAASADKPSASSDASASSSSTSGDSSSSAASSKPPASPSKPD